MSTSELKKLILEQKKDDTDFISPKKTRKPSHIEIWESIAVAELIRCMELVKLDDKEILSFLSRQVLGWSNWQLSRAAKGMSHTSVNKHVKTAKEKMEPLRDSLMKSSQNKEAVENDEEMTLTEKEEIGEIFEKHSNYEREKPDRHKSSKYKKDSHDLYKKVSK